MPPIDPTRARQFAVEVVRRLRAAGHEALWAGGCVRDRLLGIEPHDYDVATSAPPDAVRQLFGRRRTLAVGAAFGVITVLGPKGCGAVQVATFRCDAAYSDGRRPDAVVFSSAREDAQRRDFTINGLFYDPLADAIIDYVGGEEDLRAGRIRAIGDPQQRIAEDKLRMLRAVRFAARFDFAIEPQTLDAIRRRAAEITVVSAERIAAEMRLLLVLPRRRRGVELLAEAGLLAVLLPEVEALRTASAGEGASGGAGWRRTLAVLERLEAPSFPLALAALLREAAAAAPGSLPLAMQVGRRWRLSSDETARTARLVECEPLLRRARQTPWPRVQRVLAAEGAAELVQLAEAAAAALDDGSLDEVAWCRQRMAQPRAAFDPPPLIDGNDLMRCGIPPGPVYAKILEAVRDAQLEGRIADAEAALALAQSLWRDGQAGGA